MRQRYVLRQEVPRLDFFYLSPQNAALTRNLRSTSRIPFSPLQTSHLVDGHAKNDQIVRFRRLKSNRSIFATSLLTLWRQNGGAECCIPDPTNYYK